MTSPLEGSLVNSGLERRRSPEIERVGGLHVVVSVEQHVRHIWIALLPVVRHDHGVTACRHNFGFGEADVFKRRRAPFGGLEAARLVGWVGRNAVDAQKFE